MIAHAIRAPHPGGTLAAMLQAPGDNIEARNGSRRRFDGGLYT